MIIYFAGAKPPTKAHPWDCPQVAAEQNLNIMTTFFEFRKMSDDKVKEFYKDLKRRRRKK